jgi:hypothetical protein
MMPGKGSSETTAMMPRFAPPPRRVTAGAAVQLLFGGRINTVGWLFLTIGTVFVWSFAPAIDLSSSWQFRAPLERAQATVSRCEKTSFSVGGSAHRRGAPVYANYYSFVASDGASRDGVSYATGRCLRSGAVVAVEYPAGKPGISRLEGMRRTPLGLGPIFVGFFPLIGLGLIIGGFRHGRRSLHMIRFGHPAQGTLESKRATNARVNHRTVYEMKFAFTGDDGIRHEAATKTSRPERLEDNEKENMLYDPEAPSRAVMLDTLPGRFSTDESGSITSASPLASLFALALPLLAIGSNAVFFYFTVLR